MPIVLNADDIKFLTGENTKVEVSEDLVLSYIREARRKKTKERYNAKKPEYNKVYYTKLKEQMNEDPELKQKQKEKRRAYYLKKKAEREAREDREDREDREARGEE